MRTKRRAAPLRTSLAPFAWVGGIWLLAGVTLSYELAEPAVRGLSVRGFLCLWALSLADLYALAKVVAETLPLAAGAPSRERSARAFRAVFWGIIKLAVLAFFAVFLIKAHSIPKEGLLTGMGTLILVPLLGGYQWSRKVLRDA